MDNVKVSFNFRYWVLGLTILTIGIWVVAFFTEYVPSDVVVLLGGVGAIVALATLVYAAMSLHAFINHNQAALDNNKNQHAEIIDLEKKRHASEIISKWQAPEMVNIVTKGYEIRSEVNKMEVKEIAEYLKSNPECQQSLICIFNYFEKMALLIEHDVVNESMLKDYFKSLIKIYYNCFSGFVKHKQREMNSNDALSSFLRLAKRWQIDCT